MQKNIQQLLQTSKSKNGTHTHIYIYLNKVIHTQEISINIRSTYDSHGRFSSHGDLVTTACDLPRFGVRHTDFEGFHGISIGIGRAC